VCPGPGARDRPAATGLAARRHTRPARASPRRGRGGPPGGCSGRWAAGRLVNPLRRRLSPAGGGHQNATRAEMPGVPREKPSALGFHPIPKAVIMPAPVTTTRGGTEGVGDRGKSMGPGMGRRGLSQLVILKFQGSATLPLNTRWPERGAATSATGSSKAVRCAQPTARSCVSMSDRMVELGTSIKDTQQRSNAKTGG